MLEVVTRSFSRPRLTAQEVSHAVIPGAMKVHSELGAGLLESTYTACLQFELTPVGVHSLAQLSLPVVYRGIKLDVGYRIDLLVEDAVVVEIKSVDAICPCAPRATYYVPQTQRKVFGSAHKFQRGSSERWISFAFTKRHFVSFASRTPLPFEEQSGVSLGDVSVRANP